MRCALVWFRRDLRVLDNPALGRAAAAGAVVPVYVHSPEEEAPWPPGAASRWWLHHSLAALDASLRARGSRLLVRRGPVRQALARLAKEAGATAVYWNRLYEPACIERDQRVEEELASDGLEVHTANAALLFEPWELETGSGSPYRVFTPFWKAAMGRFPPRAPEPEPERLEGPGTWPRGEALEALGLLPRIRWDAGLEEAWTPGEAGALRALDRFCDEAAAEYADARDRPAGRGTSRLSPHLHFGEIGPATVAARIQRLQATRRARGVARGTETFLKELGWREFAHHLLYHFPETPGRPLNRAFERFAWKKDYAADLERWQQGRTGIPIVDAGMRELWATGWMHNRVRMVAASLLVKNLRIPWTEGARWFWDTLVDADLANNTLGWQWVAGCGADAAPYFRIFNPVLQSRKFDADGEYLRRWVPELSGVDGKALHAPWEAARPPAGYPGPIVDLKASRERALAAFRDLPSKG